VHSTTITPVRTGNPETEPVGDSCLIFDRAFAESGSNRASVMAAFESSLEELRGADREDRLRDIAKAAALSTARSHGNIIETGRTLLGNLDELGAKHSLDVLRCKDQVMLGLAEGACQIGPIVYGRFLDIASEYRDNADDWIAKNKRRVTAFEFDTLPVIVPFEAELTLSAKPFRDPAQEIPTEVQIVTTDKPTTSRSENTAQPEEVVQTGEATTPQWSRPKGKGFFQRLTDVMGNFFGRS
jgi:hypothetical protein